MSQQEFQPGDRVICDSMGVTGTVIESCQTNSQEEITTIAADNNMLYRAPTRCWRTLG